MLASKATRSSVCGQPPPSLEVYQLISSESSLVFTKLYRILLGAGIVIVTFFGTLSFLFPSLLRSRFGTDKLKTAYSHKCVRLLVPSRSRLRSCFVANSMDSTRRVVINPLPGRLNFHRLHLATFAYERSIGHVE